MKCLLGRGAGRWGVRARARVCVCYCWFVLCILLAAIMLAVIALPPPTPTPPRLPLPHSFLETAVAHSRWSQKADSTIMNVLLYNNNGPEAVCAV